mmetsp:Transcript_73250/g.203184  ORF Transcript_73250/g.203184 Transcript_73250/m.203184 type:complete len:201 (-) Transcript_73250:36-638(-)
MLTYKEMIVRIEARPMKAYSILWFVSLSQDIMIRVTKSKLPSSSTSISSSEGSTSESAGSAGGGNPFSSTTSVARMPTKRRPPVPPGRKVLTREVPRRPTRGGAAPHIAGPMTTPVGDGATDQPTMAGSTNTARRRRRAMNLCAAWRRRTAALTATAVPWADANNGSAPLPARPYAGHGPPRTDSTMERRQAAWPTERGR